MAAAPVDAQEAVTLDFAGGVGIPGGDLADFQDIGPAFDIGLNIRVHPRFSLRASGGAEIFDGAVIENAFDNSVTEQGFADFSTVHFNGGGVLHAVNEGPLRVDFNGGAGVTILTSERRELSGAGGDANLVEIVDLSETYLNITAGLDIGYMVSEQVELFVGGDGHLFFMDEDGEAEGALNNIAPGLSAPSQGWTVPVAGGVRFHFEP
jgi:catechol 2,3-dioxygenase-like lactoylglutathione lyase family enzyme